MSDSEGYWSRAASARYGRRRLLRAGAASAIGAAALAGGLACGSRKPQAAGTNTAGNAPVAGAPPKLEQGKNGGKLVYVTANEPPDFDPRLTESIGLYGVLTSVSNRLIRTVQGGEAKSFYDYTLKPELAESWEQPADLTSLTVKLNKGVKWHDVAPVSGRELTSADIKYTFDSYRSSGAHTASFDSLERVETPDAYTAKFVLNQPFGGFLETLTTPTQVVFAHEVIEKYGDLKSVMIGTGPFMTSRFERGVGYAAVKNPNYFKKGLPYLDGIETPFITDGATRKASFRSGQADIVQLADTGELKEVQSSNPSLQSQEVLEPRSNQALMMNPQDTGRYSDVRVRRAMSMAIDRVAIRKGLFQDHATVGGGIPWFFYQDAPPTQDQLGPYFQYNPAEAKKLLEAAGYKDGFKDTYSYFEYDTSRTSIAQLVQAQLKKNLNIDLEIKQMDYPTYFQAYSGRKLLGTYQGGQLASGVTVDDFTYKYVLSDSVSNYSHMADAEIDRLARAIRREGDVTKRKALVKQMIDREQDQVFRPWLPYRFSFYVVQPHVRGYYYVALRGGGCQDYGGAARELHWSAKA